MLFFFFFLQEERRMFLTCQSLSRLDCRKDFQAGAIDVNGLTLCILNCLTWPVSGHV